MRIEPKNGYLVIKEPERETVEESGIIIPESATVQDDVQVAYGEVIGVEEGNSYSKGDVIIFQKVIPNDFEVELTKGKKEKVWFLHYEDVLGVLK